MERLLHNAGNVLELRDHVVVFGDRPTDFDDRVSWNASLPMKCRATWPVIATIGMLSSLASARQVTRLVAPGPLVAMHTPTLPVARA